MGMQAERAVAPVSIFALIAGQSPDQEGAIHLPSPKRQFLHCHTLRHS